MVILMYQITKILLLYDDDIKRNSIGHSKLILPKNPPLTAGEIYTDGRIKVGIRPYRRNGYNISVGSIRIAERSGVGAGIGSR
jgi:hypothetical protein